MRLRSLFGTVLCLVLVASMATVSEAKPKAKPVKTTLYMHGNYPVGEVDGADWLANATPPMAMDPNEPTDAQPKSMTFFNPALNDQCSGLPLGFATWVGPLAGTITGDAKLTAHFVSAPGTIKARIWVDTPVFSCNDAFIPPAAEVDVTLPAGPGSVEIVFPKLKLKGTYNIMIELLAYSGADYKGQVGRVLYDSTSYATSLEFMCTPAKGNSCV